MALITLVVLVIFVDSISHWIDPNASWYSVAQNSLAQRRTLTQARDFLRVQEVLQTDEAIIAQRLGLSIDDSQKAFPADPFLRLNDRAFGPERVTRSSVIQNVDALLTEEKNYDGPYYILEEEVARYVTDGTDDVLYKSLYCDREGYNALDATILSNIQDFEGGYGDTHALLGLVILQELQCTNKELIERDIEEISGRLVKAQNGASINDLFMERVVLLYWAGKGNLVRQHWMLSISAAQHDDGGFAFSEGGVSDPHSTALAALALTYYQDGKDHQPVILP